MRWRVMGILNVTPDSFSDGGEWLDGDAAIAHGRELVAQGAADPRRRRRVDAPRRRARSPVEEELRRVVPVVAGLAADARRAGLGRHDEGRGRARGARARARRTSTTSPRCVTTRRWPALVADRRLRLLPHAHARRARARCRTTRATTTSSTRSGPSWPSASTYAARRRASRADRIQLDPGIGFGKTARAQPRAAAPPRRDRRARVPGRRGRLAQGVPRAAHRARGPRTSASRRRSPPTSSRFERGARVFRVHDVAATVDALAVAAATLRRA